MITLLQIAPMAYKVGFTAYLTINSHSWQNSFAQAEEDLFLNMLMKALVVPKVTLEHKYTSQLFSVDCFHHVLFHGFEVQLATALTDAAMTLQIFLSMRMQCLQSRFILSVSHGEESLNLPGILSNLSNQIRIDINHGSDIGPGSTKFNSSPCPYETQPGWSSDILSSSSSIERLARLPKALVRRSKSRGRRVSFSLIDDIIGKGGYEEELLHETSGDDTEGRSLDTRHSALTGAAQP